MISEQGSGFGEQTEATLIKQAQAGCQESLNLLLIRHEGLVHLVVQRQWLCTLPYDQAIQEGRRGLWRAILGFDPKRKNRFSTHAYIVIMKYVWAAVKAEQRRLRREVPLGSLVVYWYQTGVDPAWLEDQHEIDQSLLALVNRLPQRLRRITVAYYGLQGQEPQSLRGIGKQLGLTGERVRQLRNEALMWLRQPAHSQELRSLLARHNQQQYELADRLAQIELTRRGGAMDGAKLTPQQTRAAEAAFVSQCSLASLQPHLPLTWPVSPGIPPSPKKSYRSSYVYPFQAEVTDLVQVLAWKDLSDFDLLLRLVDFCRLRSVLAHLLGWQSGRGWQPFDPVSLFLLVAGQIVNRWKRSQVLRNLADPRYADYTCGFGFQNGIYPTEGGVRHFLTCLGRNSDAGGEIVEIEQGEARVQVLVQELNRLLADAVGVLQEAKVLSEQAWNDALLCPDGQLHDAASQNHCISITESCYQPCTPDQPRTCPAKDKERRGCVCNSLACALVCRHATPRDPEARYVWYTGSNQSAEHPNRSTKDEDGQTEHGEGHYGYRSLPLRLADPLRRFSVTLLNDVRPANQHEDLPGAALLLQLKDRYPDLHVAAVAGDAGFGFDSFLHTVYTLPARRVVDLRQHFTDRNKPLWPTRGYDDRGRPVCNYGYRLVSYGFDPQRQRHKWCCDQACLKGKEPEVRLAKVVYPPPECPYQAQTHKHGRIMDVGERFADTSIRLVRDVPVGSSTWKALYRRANNAVEGRNARLEDWRLKRMPVYGLPRVKALIFLADTLDTLTTLARLVREATQVGCAA